MVLRRLVCGVRVRVSKPITKFDVEYWKTLNCVILRVSRQHLERVKNKIIRWIFGVTLKDRKTNQLLELHERIRKRRIK